MPPTWSRRTLIQSLSAAALAVPLTNLPSTVTAYAATTADATTVAPDAYDTLRARWRTLLLGTGFDPAAAPYAAKLTALGANARTYAASMAPATGSLWPDYPFLTASAGVTNSYARLSTMAQAWAQPGTGSTADPALLAKVVTGLDHLHTQAYNATRTTYDNWWDWQIGSPRLLLDICALAYDSGSLSADRISAWTAAVDHFVPDSAVASYAGTSTGANRVDLCRVLALRGVIGKSDAKLALARDALSPVFPYVTTGDGFYADGSFIQHTWVPYTGSYGQVLIDGLGRLFALLGGSGWAVTDPNRQLFLDMVEKAYAPWIYNGLLMDPVVGRAQSRGVSAADAQHVKQDDHLRGHTLLANIAVLAQGASTAEQARWKGLLKGWIGRDAFSPVLSDPQLGVADLSRLKAVADATGTAAVAEPVAHRLFGSMDRAVHRRSGWAASISMCSARTTFYETGNGENLRGWHTNNGMLSWWGADFGNGQYSDDFWPTVNPYRLPGTTVSTKPLADAYGGAWGAARPDTVWAGGATDGEFAAVGQYVKGLGSTMLGKKSWFCLDDAIVCLGAGIKATDGVRIESVIDNRNLGASGTHAFTVDGTAQPATLGWTKTFTGAKWAQLAGFGGYVFPGGATFSALREARTGSWHDINTGGTTDAVTRRYLTTWYDHGVDPTAGTYAYLLMPGATTAATAARAAASSWLTVLANNAAQQAISVPSLGVTAANFWNAGTVGALTVTAPAAILIRVTGSTATVSVSDPTHTGTAFDLTWSRAVTAVTAHDPTVTVAATGAALRLTVAPGKAGASHHATVTLA
ncbi:polysaccharide lyase 8 family protein [Streptomyces sp. NPDC093221]|uniref:polysaccharide lyase 8 family protein n=1 Tax=Streptomyces sp. NPDC093221 TaxID=3366032 RepID=UPI003830CD1A